MQGVFYTALLGAAISVYVLHDVDQDKVGHWNEAFAGLFTESILFTLLVGGAVALLTFLGRHLLHLTAYSPRAFVGLSLGLGVTIFQYPWDFIARREVPKLADISLLLYLIFVIIFCTAVLLRDNFSQMKLCEASKTSSSV